MKFPEQRLDLSSFGKVKKILSPYTSWLTVRVLVQLERITFRAVLIFLRTALLVCSESDTFLKNYIIDNHLCKLCSPSKFCFSFTPPPALKFTFSSHFKIPHG